MPLVAVCDSQPTDRLDVRARELDETCADSSAHARFRDPLAARVGDLLFVSGQAGYDERGEIVGGGFDAQAAQAFANLERALRGGGASLAEVVKVTIFVTDMAANFPTVVERRRQHFTPPYPADSIVEVASLYTPEAQIEIEAIAVVGAERTPAVARHTGRDA